jgi:hypothetical protein
VKPRLLQTIGPCSLRDLTIRVTQGPTYAALDRRVTLYFSPSTRGNLAQKDALDAERAFTGQDLPSRAAIVFRYFA